MRAAQDDADRRLREPMSPAAHKRLNRQLFRAVKKISAKFYRAQHDQLRAREALARALSVVDERYASWRPEPLP